MAEDHQHLPDGDTPSRNTVRYLHAAQQPAHRALLAQLPAGAVMVDMAGHILLTSGSPDEDDTTADLLARPQVIDPRQYPESVRRLGTTTQLVAKDSPLVQVLSGAGPVEMELAYRCRGDEVDRCAHVVARPMLNRAGRIAGAVAIVTDTTQQPRQQAANTAAQRRLAYDAVTCGVIVYSPEGRTLYANAMATQILGRTLTSLPATGEGDADVLLPLVTRDGQPLRQENHPVVLASQTRQPHRGAVLGSTRPDGSRRWIQVDAVPVFDSTERLIEVVVSIVDVTSLTQLEGVARVNEQRLTLLDKTLQLLAEAPKPDMAISRVISAVGLGVNWQVGLYWAVDERDNVLRCACFWSASDVSLVRLEEFSRKMTIGPDVGVLGHVWTTGEAAWITDLTRQTTSLRFMQATREGLRCCFCCPVVAGTMVHGVMEFFSYSPRPVDADQWQTIVTVGRQVGQALDRARMIATAAPQAQHDSLTGLPNRTLFFERLDQTLAAAKQDGTPVSVLMLNIDRFKQINDELGHQGGDVLLRQIVERLSKILTEAEFLGRLGGDEFAAVLPNSDSAATVQRLSQISAVLADSFVIDGHTIDVGARMGIASAPDHGDDATTLLRHASVAADQSKQHGNGYMVYNPGTDRNPAGRLRLSTDLRQSIAQNELVLYYQPKIDFTTGRVSGVEALARWQHPQRGLVLPDEFISLAEDSRIIGPLTEWSLATALAQAQRWHEAGRPLDIAVNLSVRTLQNPRLPEIVAQLLQQYKIPPSSLTLEITEGSVMADPVHALATLTQLAATGARLSIDDFGAGQTSLNYLRKMPVHEIKIDKSFVLDIATNPSNSVIVSSAIGLGHGLGLRVVAEGVEERTAWDVLVELGCDTIQGFYISRPLPAIALDEWLITSAGSTVASLTRRTRRQR